MPTFKIILVRPTYDFAEVTVEAASSREAEERAFQMDEDGELPWQPDLASFGSSEIDDIIRLED